jgi:hypothetical protein
MYELVKFDDLGRGELAEVIGKVVVRVDLEAVIHAMLIASLVTLDHPLDVRPKVGNLALDVPAPPLLITVYLECDSHKSS